MTPSRWRWGLLLITIGVMLLLNNSGSLDWEYWIELLKWWPIILIAIGLEKIFLKSKLQFVSYLAPLIMIFTMVYVAIDTGSDDYRGGFFSRRSWETEADASVKMMDATLEHGSADLHITANTHELASARFDRFSRKPTIRFSKSDGTAKLEVIRKGRPRNYVIVNGKPWGRDWRVSFSNDTPLKLKCIGDQSHANFNLESVALEDLTVENEEGDINLRIGTKRPAVNVIIEGTDAEFRMKVPEGCGIRVPGDKYSEYLKTIGLVQGGDGYSTTNFDAAATKVILKIADDLRHLSIEYY